MHQILFRLGLRRPLAGFKGPTSKRKERNGGKGREKEGVGWEERGREGREGELITLCINTPSRNSAMGATAGVGSVLCVQLRA